MQINKPDKYKRIWMMHIILYPFFILSALIFLLLLQPFDKGIATILDHFIMNIYILSLFVIGIIMEHFKNIKLIIISRFSYLFGLYFLTSYIWNLIYYYLKYLLEQFLIPSIWIRILIQIPGYIMPLSLILFYRYKYKINPFEEYRLKFGKLNQKINIFKDRSGPAWIFLFIIFVFYTIPFTLWAAGFFDNPIVELLLYPKNLNLFFPLILYVFVEIIKTEMFFRGFLQKEAEQALGIQGAFIFQAIAYALPHYMGGHPGGLIGGTFMLIGAYFLGFFTKKTNGLSFAVICHFFGAFLLQLYTF